MQLSLEIGSCSQEGVKYETITITQDNLADMMEKYGALFIARALLDKIELLTN